MITDVRSSTKGPQVIVSRRSDKLVRELFKLEVPEMADGLVEIVGVAREPGWRSKIAVVSHVQGVDPVGACVGPRGSRVRMVVSELRGEKIDIIPFHEEPARYVAKALSPARVREVLVDDEDRQATVIVPDDQLSLAIGREGMNARLAARLTGWRIDIKSESTFSREEAETDDGDDDSRQPLPRDAPQRATLPERRGPADQILQPARARVARGDRGVARARPHVGRARAGQHREGLRGADLDARGRRRRRRRGELIGAPAASGARPPGDGPGPRARAPHVPMRRCLGVRRERAQARSGTLRGLGARRRFVAGP